MILTNHGLASWKSLFIIVSLDKKTVFMFLYRFSFCYCRLVQINKVNNILRVVVVAIIRGRCDYLWSL